MTRLTLPSMTWTCLSLPFALLNQVLRQILIQLRPRLLQQQCQCLLIPIRGSPAVRLTAISRMVCDLEQ